METHLERVDRSLEELTKKVQKHTTKKTPDLINYSFEKSESKEGESSGKFSVKTLLKPPYVFMIGLPLMFLILLLYLQPSFITEIDDTDPSKQKRYVSVKKLLWWTIGLAGIAGGVIYYVFYMKKQENNKE